MCKWCEQDSKLAVADVVHFVADNMDKIDHVLMGLLERQFRFVQAHKENDEVNRWVKGFRFLGTVGRTTCLVFVASLAQTFYTLRRVLPHNLSSPNAQPIVSPPGQTLLRLAEFLFSRKTVTLTFKPLIADWHLEYFEALQSKLGKWHLRMLTLRYYWYYAKACGLSKVGTFFKAVARH